MSGPFSQAFRSKASSKIISIPARHDPKSGKNVVRWKDILQYFENAKGVMNGELAVLFLTDDDLEDLIPLRIAQYPDTILEVVVPDDNEGMDDSQGDSNSFGFHHNGSHVAVERLQVTGSNHEVVSVARDVASLRISDADNNQALVVRSQGHPTAIAMTRPSNTSPNQYQQGATLQEQLHQLQQQVEGILRKMQQTDQQIQQTQQQMQQTGQQIQQTQQQMQQTDQQIQQTQQQMQDRIDKIIQALHMMDQRHNEETQRATQLSHLHRQRIEEVEQRIEKLDQEVQDSRRQTQDIQGQAQHQMDEVLRKVQEMNQQALNTRLQQNHLSFERRSRGAPQAFDQFAHAQHRIQAFLANPPVNSLVPRFFILLPTSIAALDGQGESCTFQYRLHFLCECSTHTMATDSNQPHEVHLANHTGYDLNNQDEFIAKYGSYLLTMMYMIKYGAKARELVVPPLLGLKHSVGKDENIDQGVDVTIAHLREAIGCVDGDTTAHQSLDATELNTLMSYLKINIGEGFSGGLSRMEIQKGHYSWICIRHLRECHESILQQLKHHINISGGVWYSNEVKVKVTSGEATQQLYDDLIKLTRIQNVENWRSITEIAMKRSSHHSGSSSTNVLSNLDDIQWLTLDFGRFAMSIKDIFRGEINDIVISIRDLSAPTLDDLEFIQQCRPVALSILETPPKKDDDRLVNILQRFLSITSLRIDCDMKRYIAVIHLVRSTREKMLQGEDKPALRLFEVVHPEVRVKASFEEGSPAIEIDTRIEFEDRQPYNVDPAMYDFICQYAWSVKTLIAPESFSDLFAKLLDESMRGRGSKIVHLEITPTSLTTPGLNAMTRVINRSQGLAYLRLNLENLDQGQQLVKKALGLLGEHKGQLTSLRLTGSQVEPWLTRIAKTFPRDVLPKLEELFVESKSSNLAGLQWITSIVSVQAQRRTPLKTLGMNMPYSAYSWEALIKVIDLLALEELHFCTNSFTPVQLKVFVDRIESYGALLLPLQLLNLSGAALDNNPDTRALILRLRMKIPRATITGIEA
ncbi:hypothetical protein BGX34_003597 [Mortierella sp. NVP85]|nr:hypothetical protein BGX34_003597 [Mortierella sp. NVP85]